MKVDISNNIYNLYEIYCLWFLKNNKWCNKFFFDDVIENDDSGIDSEFELLFVDFVCMVIFMFFKVFLGVVCYKDFIWCLFVYLVKYIFKLLDKMLFSYVLLVS